MKEKDFQTEFGKWLKTNWKCSAAFELKICKEKRFNLKRIEEHQIMNLIKVKHSILSYKISDSGLGQKPFDSFTLYQAPAYLVILFYKPRKPKMFYMIDVDKITSLIALGTKSITEDEAHANCFKYDIVK